MPIYTPMPEDVGERRFAERLADLDDGKLHLWFDLTLPTVPTLDVVIWDETAGVFLVEVKSVPLALLLKFSDTDMEMRDAGWSRSPVQKARIASSRLVDYLREVGCPAIRVACTVAWPRITRSEWKERWSGESFPKDYELSMLFVDDVRGGIAGLRERLRWIAENPPTGF